MKRKTMEENNTDLKNYIKALEDAIKNEYIKHKGRKKKYNKCYMKLLSVLQHKGYNARIIEQSNYFIAPHLNI